MPDLYPYQVEGAAWLAARPYRYLADDMGLGKTCQAIVACDITNSQRVLIVCPSVVKANWARELANFSIYDRPTALIRSANEEIPSLGCIAISFELAAAPAVLEKLLAYRWDAIIVDEAHFLKSVDATRAKAILGKLAHRTKRFYLLSGTPAPNGCAAELWTALYTFGVTPLKYDEFIRRYCYTKESRYGIKPHGTKNTDELRSLIAPFMLRRKKEDVMADLPPLRITEITVEPGPVDEELFFYPRYHGRMEQLHPDLAEQEATLRGFFVHNRSSGNRTPSIDACKILDASQTPLSTLRMYTGLQKVQPVVDLVKSELESGLDKVVLFGWHKDAINSIRDGLKEYKAVSLYGGTPDEKKQRNIHRFIHDKRCRVFVGQIKAVGVGIDGLQKVCNNALIFEPSWVPGDNAQAIMRLHRNGQEKPVLARFVSLAGSVDEQVSDALVRKTRDLTKLFG